MGKGRKDVGETRIEDEDEDEDEDEEEDVAKPPPPQSDKNIYRVHIWYSCISIHSLDFRSLTHLIINIHTILLRSKPIRHGYGRRKRPAAQDRTTTTGPKRH